MGLYRYGNVLILKCWLKFSTIVLPPANQVDWIFEIKQKNKVKTSWFCNLKRQVNLNGGQYPNWH